MNSKLFKLLVLLCIPLFSTNAFSKKPPKGLVSKYERACSEIGLKVLEKMPAFNTNISEINDSLITLELTLSEYSDCIDKSVTLNSPSADCEINKTNYRNKTEEHAQLVLINKHQQKELFLLMKKYTNKHCPME